ncbi:putative disease resistance protein RGA3 [Cornus florida]|uniref:putative disease resistance protein RGA3 n=1 Tax=Cornus florida TaxID=4283 RepID=UPI00289E9660|nr:putative disease resistance protein RGA3 [Cornus florida]XP_059641933.1 putative disease resistance protein RGA3 [Cornus florida]XP_059641934.1 putative disease resistance protein RGA3 [Cornus florida]XP_059641935.1 putative disease resistance protein RGA3 [Cornus florida]
MAVFHLLQPHTIRIALLFNHSSNHKKMVDAVLSNIVTEIVKKLSSAAFQETQLLFGLKTESRRLEDTISTVKAVLLDAQQQQHDPDNQASVWLKKLKEVVDDADDLLDDFSTEDLQRKVMTSNKKAKKVLIFFSSSNQLFFRLKMSHKVKAIRERLDAIAETKIKFHFSVEPPIDMQLRIDRREDSHSFVVAENVIGRDNDKKAIVELLMHSEVQENVSVVAIVGIGGMGKTALAQLVSSDENVKKHFEINMWVCVSEDFGVEQVAKYIIESATGEKTEGLQMDGVQKKLREIIDGKKYFLVLDDVWNENRDRWLNLRDLLKGGAKGSKILITTRSKLVATTSGANSPYVLESLSEEESWSLFKQMAFKGKNELQNARRVEMGQEIVKKCAGVPLAIRVLGSLLYSKDTENEWLNFKNKDMAKIAQEENIILPMLKLSYDHLPSYLKQCFAFCRLYPKDHEIDKQQLIQLWSAHGFILLSNANEDLEDVGDLYFRNLLRRSFFQDESKDKLGNIISCKLHDLMHDLAVLVAGSESSTVLVAASESWRMNLDSKDVSPRTCHVSFDSKIHGSSEWEIPAPLLGNIKIRTFFLPAQGRGFYSDTNLFTYRRKDNSVYVTIVSNFQRLRVLDLHCLEMKTLPSCIGKLRHLRYLDISGNQDINALPNSITKLQNLQTLKLDGCYDLEELPRDIRKLVSLRHLEFDGCDRLSMPRGLGELTCLRTFKRFIVGPSSRLSELKDLNNLRGELSIELQRRPRLKEAEEANLKEKQHLQSLIFDFGAYDDDDGELE